jgi:NDP-sugar pyrophosphorylase family protein
MVILTINGKGNRFLEAGITTPKFLLPYDNSTVIGHIIYNLKSGFPQGASFYVGLNIDYKGHIPYLTDLFRNYDMQHEIILLEDTKGQADTVRVILEKIGSSGEPMWIVNCDTLVSNTWQFEYPEAEIVVETFESNLPLYSYIDNLEKVTQIAEKKVISDHASTGNYYFSENNKFKELFIEAKYDKEIFISDVIQCGIDKNLKVMGINVPSHSVKVLGTPAQYEKNIKY